MKKMKRDAKKEEPVKVSRAFEAQSQIANEPAAGSVNC